MVRSMSMGEYRQGLRDLPTAELVDLMRSVRDRLRSQREAPEFLSDDWQARELLAELASRQGSLF